MKIYAKSKLTQNIYDKINKGAEAIEIHLDDEYKKSFELINSEFVAKTTIKVVHSPLIGRLDTCVDHMMSWDVLEETFGFAQKIAEMKGYNIIVVAHLSSHIEELQMYGIYDKILTYIRDLMSKYPNVELAIENSTARGSINAELAFRSVLYKDPERLAKDINHERVGTCLDTCHAMMDIKTMKLTRDFLGKESEDYENLAKIQTMRDYFEANKDVCKLIHLANIEKHGAGRDHGRPFTKKYKKKLKKIVKLYEEFEYTCPITIEVQEDDYSDAVNFLTTKELLDRILSRKEKTI